MTNNSGGPFDSTRSLVMHLYQTGFQFFRMGGASAVAWVLFLIVSVFTLIQFQLQRGSAIGFFPDRDEEQRKPEEILQRAGA